MLPHELTALINCTNRRYTILSKNLQRFLLLKKRSFLLKSDRFNALLAHVAFYFILLVLVAQLLLWTDAIPSRPYL